MTALALLRRFWWALPMLALAAALLATRATLADRTATLRAERSAWTSALDAAEKVRLETERRFATNVAQAATNYADGLAARQPIIVRSTNTVREYAQTDAGRVLCRDADRVRAIDALDAELAEAARSAGGGAGPVRADAAAAAGGR
ncbi:MULTISPECIES: hypothetical protein [Sphingomonas]|uniref:Uncharacterized protein n=1 Tax=Sphingomonas molluscorum TaxID=418184 RepID=A0ABU8Q5A9_9SPHN|nr:hypothetical protein [Sphingomonas sp. JUb134]MBM7405675.1 hypothetical protein [Sphingomonas sp. JUb134]